MSYYKILDRKIGMMLKDIYIYIYIYEYQKEYMVEKVDKSEIIYFRR